MEPLKLRYYPDPILRETSKAVEVFDDELREFAAGMVDTMYREKGIGLAAPQVGVTKRVIVVLQMKDPEDVDAQPLVMINPRVVVADGDLWSFEEGCLSIPGINAAVLRPTHVEVEYQDVDGRLHSVTDESMMGRIMLHEIDHLNGKLFIDYLSSAQKSIIKTQLKHLTDSGPPS